VARVRFVIGACHVVVRVARLHFPIVRSRYPCHVSCNMIVDQLKLCRGGTASWWSVHSCQ
jgi:hypothetical protein